MPGCRPQPHQKRSSGSGSAAAGATTSRKRAWVSGSRFLPSTRCRCHTSTALQATMGCGAWRQRGQGGRQAGVPAHGCTRRGPAMGPVQPCAAMQLTAAPPAAAPALQLVQRAGQLLPQQVLHAAGAAGQRGARGRAARGHAGGRQLAGVQRGGQLAAKAGGGGVRQLQHRLLQLPEVEQHLGAMGCQRENDRISQGSGASRGPKSWRGGTAPGLVGGRVEGWGRKEAGGRVGCRSQPGADVGRRCSRGSRTGRAGRRCAPPTPCPCAAATQTIHERCTHLQRGAHVCLAEALQPSLECSLRCPGGSDTCVSMAARCAAGSRSRCVAGWLAPLTPAHAVAPQIGPHASQHKVGVPVHAPQRTGRTLQPTSGCARWQQRWPGTRRPSPTTTSTQQLLPMRPAPSTHLGLAAHDGGGGGQKLGVGLYRRHAR